MRLCFLADAKITHTQRWVRFFARQGHEVHLISFREEALPGVMVHPVKRTIPVRISPVASTLGKLGYFTYVRKFKNLIGSIAPDILHAHWATSYGLMGAWSGYHPFVLSTWGSDVFDFPHRSFWHRKLLQYILGRADHLTATSRMLTAETKLYLKNAKEVHTIPFGVDISRFRPLERDPDAGVTVGIVKRLEKKYGIDYLIRAFAHIAGDHPQSKLLIVGDGSEETSLKRLAEELNVRERIHFAGYVDNDAVPEYLNRMDIFVVPSVLSSETFGVAAVEAAACQLPVIASDIGGLPEVVLDGETGFLVPSRDDRAVAERLDRLIADESLRKRMGIAGRRFVEEHYVWEANAMLMSRLYKRILTGGIE